VIGLRRGPGSFWRGEINSGNWFHVSIPTPATINDAAVWLTKVYVKYSVGDGTIVPNGASITDVQVWEGSNRLLQFGPRPADQGWFGDHTGALDSSNTFVLPNPVLVSSGIGISLRIEFIQGGEPNVLFTAAGAEFEPYSFNFSVVNWLGSLWTKVGSSP
jgi:hypothetical protein